MSSASGLPLQERKEESARKGSKGSLVGNPDQETTSPLPKSAGGTGGENRRPRGEMEMTWKGSTQGSLEKTKRGGPPIVSVVLKKERISHVSSRLRRGKRASGGAEAGRGPGTPAHRRRAQGGYRWRALIRGRGERVARMRKKGGVRKSP